MASHIAEGCRQWCSLDFWGLMTSQRDYQWQTLVHTRLEGTRSPGGTSAVLLSDSVQVGPVDLGRC